MSDSEEERQRCAFALGTASYEFSGKTLMVDVHRRIRLKRAALATMNQNELPIVVISSDEEDGSRCVDCEPYL